MSADRMEREHGYNPGNIEAPPTKGDDMSNNTTSKEHFEAIGRAAQEAGENVVQAMRDFTDALNAPYVNELDLGGLQKVVKERRQKKAQDIEG